MTSAGMAEVTPATLREMQAKHPQPANPLPPLPDSEVSSPTFTISEVTKAALSFRKGTAAGPSGMRPEHFAVVLKGPPVNLAGKAQGVLTKLVNAMAAGKVPQAVSPFLCGARLHAGKKKDGGLRPIAVGNLIRRLVAKCFSSRLSERAASLLKPHQLGVGVKAGCEAVAHAVRKAVKDDPSLSVLQVDFINAYNSVDRGSIIEATAKYFPECLEWVKTCYGSASCLKFGDEGIASTNGVHQGDPLAS